MPAQPKATLSQAMNRLYARLSGRLAHAFAMPAHNEALSVEELDLLERMADRIVRKGMAAPAMLFLESVAPLNFLGSQILHAVTPLLNLACRASEFDRAARLLERRDSFSRLVALIEAKTTAAPRQ